MKTSSLLFCQQIPILTEGMQEASLLTRVATCSSYNIDRKKIKYYMSSLFKAVLHYQSNMPFTKAEKGQIRFIILAS